MDENSVHSLINYELLVCEVVQSVSFGISVFLSQPVPSVCLGVCRETVTPGKRVCKFWRFVTDEFLNIWQKKIRFFSFRSIVQVLKVIKIVFRSIFVAVCFCSSDFEFG